MKDNRPKKTARSVRAPERPGQALRKNTKEKNKAVETLLRRIPAPACPAAAGETAGRIRAERVLQGSEFRMLAENSPDLIARFDSQFRHLYVNPAAAKSGPLAPEEYVGKTIGEVGVSPDEARKWEGRLKAVFETHRVVEVEDSFMTPEGRRYFHTKFVPEFGADGTVHSVISLARDITERKRSEEALRISNDRFAHLASRVPAFLAYVNAETLEYEYVNGLFEKLFGMPREKIIGSHIKNIIGEANFLFAMKFIDEARRGKTVSYENSFDLVSGKRWIQVNYSPVTDSGGRVASIVVLSYDITDLKQAQARAETALEEAARKAKELQEKNDELTRFTYAVSHDLRSPLVTVQTFLGHLEDDLRDRNRERVGEDLGFIKIAADKMGRLLDELLRLSRVGRMINPAVEVSLQAVVKEALGVTAGRIAERGVRIEVTTEPVILYGDHARLVEIFQNLVDNAAKFMGGQPEPRIEIGVEIAGGKTVLFVRDNGIGLNPDFSPRLFGLFEKFDAATDGVGLGLALVRRIVELHGGRIWAESEGPGRGSTFWFTLVKTRRASGENDQT